MISTRLVQGNRIHDFRVCATVQTYCSACLKFKFKKRFVSACSASAIKPLLVGLAGNEEINLTIGTC